MKPKDAPHEHSWPRLPNYGVNSGRRVEIEICNDNECLAVRVTYQVLYDEAFNVTIVEPPENRE